jgi:PIN domain nuclease of toxin-antitoxin system
VLWSLLEPKKLSKTMKSALEEPSNKLYVSSITAWEILILVEKKQVTLNTDDPPGWIRSNFREIPLIELPINNEIAIQSRLIDLPQKDPADRFLAAAAIVHDMAFVTANKQFGQSKQLRIIF